MAAFFHLRVLASDRAFYDGDCESLTVPVSDGELGTALVGLLEAEPLVGHGAEPLVGRREIAVRPQVQRRVLAVNVRLVIIGIALRLFINAARAACCKRRFGAHRPLGRISMVHILHSLFFYIWRSIFRMLSRARHAPSSGPPLQ